MNPEEIRKILTYDGLDDAEKMTGASYKESAFTESIGVMNVIENNAKRHAAMLLTGDTMYGCVIERYLSIAHNIGFKDVLEVPFVGEYSKHERLCVLWRNGILLKFDTYGGKRVNSGNFYYNWKPHSIDALHPYVSGGGLRQDKTVWVGGHDCREALVFHITELEKHGVILPNWVERPFLWLLHYMDCRVEGYDYEAITEARIALLPKEVRDAITPDVKQEGGAK